MAGQYIRNSRSVVHGHARRDKHGGKTGLYLSWLSIKARLRGLSYHGRNYYQHKAVQMNPLWETFEFFEKDMKKGWFKGATLHRRNGWEGYWKKNCVWMSKSEHCALHNKLRGRKDYGK